MTNWTSSRALGTTAKRLWQQWTAPTWACTTPDHSLRKVNIRCVLTVDQAFMQCVRACVRERDPQLMPCVVVCFQ